MPKTRRETSNTCTLEQGFLSPVWLLDQEGRLQAPVALRPGPIPVPGPHVRQRQQGPLHSLRTHPLYSALLPPLPPLPISSLSPPPGPPPRPHNRAPAPSLPFAPRPLTPAPTPSASTSPHSSTARSRSRPPLSAIGCGGPSLTTPLARDCLRRGSALH